MTTKDEIQELLRFLSRCKSTASNGYKQGQGASERQTDKVRAASAGMA